MELLVAIVVFVLVAAVVAVLIARGRGGGVIALPKDARRPDEGPPGRDDPPASS